MSVVVAVRVRPFNDRESELGSQLCVKMSGNTTTVEDEQGNSRSFTFDYSFWSHSGFEINENGVAVAKHSNYADQSILFEKVGNNILNNAIEGYHCCLFAYGQTGAGKSYSMIGYGPNKGIVPQVSESLFERIHKDTNLNKFYEINVSMIEIYNEKVQDLFASVGSRPIGGLKIRESKTLGIYVENLSKHHVTSYKSIEDKMAEGNRNRTIASTQMNSSSSRAHTIITIEFRQIEKLSDRKVERMSVINLVDLAGSEKVAKSGAVGDRFKEGCSINRSLTILGQVITVLAEKSCGRSQGRVVPYRDSSLTRILQNALGGNSKTLMICAISPSLDNFEETLSTLRYADQAKRIKNHAIINESETDKKIRALEKENEELRALIRQLKINNTEGSLNLNGESMNRIHELESQLKSQNSLLVEEEMFNESNEVIEESPSERQSDSENPGLININEDPQLTGKLFYDLYLPDSFIVGRPEALPQPNLILRTIGVQPIHARIYKKTDQDSNIVYFLSPCVDDTSIKLFVNGVRITKEVALNPMDRILFGVSTFFVFIDPKTKDSKSLPDWTSCYEELEEKIDAIDSLVSFNGGISRMEDWSLNEEPEEAIVDFEKVQKNLEAEFRRKAEEEKLFLGPSNNLFIKKSKKQEDKISRINSLVYEANIAASQLGRKIEFKLQTSQSFETSSRSKLRIEIRVDNYEEKRWYIWDKDFFTERLCLIREMLVSYLETGKLLSYDKHEDPFWDSIAPMRVAEAFLKMMSLAYLLDNPTELSFVAEEGEIGIIIIDIIPCNNEGVPIEVDQPLPEHVIDDPSELLNRSLHFLIKIGLTNKILKNKKQFGTQVLYQILVVSSRRGGLFGRTAISN